MKFIIALSLTFFSLNNVNAQLSNGSIAPDFYLYDIDGNPHHLYDYLDNGKAVFIDFFACHCPSCWAYHNTGTLESLYQSYGPAGTNEIVVFMIEYDANNGYNEFHGISGVTQGDWVTGTSFPQINPEGADRSILTDYNVNYYPLVYKICPDHTIEIMSTGYSSADLYLKAGECAGNLSVDENEDAFIISQKFENNELVLIGNEEPLDLNVYNSVGQLVYHKRNTTERTFDLSYLQSGIYLVNIEFIGGVINKTIRL